MKYISCAGWRDLTDGHLYREGESFPFDGREISEKRLDELANGRNRAGLRLIMQVAVPEEQTEAWKEEAPKTAEKPRKTATRKTKK